MVLMAFAEVVSVALLRGLFLACIGQVFWGVRMVQKLLSAAPGSSPVNALLVVFAAAFAFIAGKSFLISAGWWHVMRQLAASQADMATTLFRNYLQAPYSTHAARSWSSLQHHLNVVTSQIFGRLIMPSLQAITEGFVLASIMIYLLVKAPLTTLLLGVWLGAIAYVFRRRVSRISHGIGRARDASSVQMFRMAHEVLSDFKSIKVRGTEDHFAAAFHARALTHATTTADDRYMMLLPRFLFEPVLIGGIGVLYLALNAVHASQQQIFANLTLYAAASLRILPAAQRLISQLHVMAFERTMVTEVVGLLENDFAPLPERPRVPRAVAFETAIAFENVSLSYPGKQAVLENIELEIRRGDKIAVIGKTGTGKTSFVNLLLGLVPPSSGRVLLDGAEINLLARYRESNIAYVQQDLFLFDSTIAENIAFAMAAENIDQARIWEALRRAGLEKTVRDMPKGLATKVGENGITLSGGERQRLALARAFYLSPSFLVLDEATSQLDVATETAILKGIFDTCPDMTLVVVTHRGASAERFPRQFIVAGRQVTEVHNSRATPVQA